MKENQKKQASSGGQTWLLVGAIVFLGIVTWYSIRATDPEGRGGLRPPVLVATLSPNLFQGPTRDAYQAARDIPEVLAELPCYCGCERTAGHDDNLHCYIDNHATG
jgi:hypothetical protein